VADDLLNEPNVQTEEEILDDILNRVNQLCKIETNYSKKIAVLVRKHTKKIKSWRKKTRLECEIIASEIDTIRRQLHECAEAQIKLLEICCIMKSDTGRPEGRDLKKRSRDDLIRAKYHIMESEGLKPEIIREKIHEEYKDELELSSIKGIIYSQKDPLPKKSQ